jgi:hypothetical protein
MGFLPVRVINHNDLECAQWQLVMQSASISEGDFKIQNKKANDYLSGSAPGKQVLIIFF